MSLHALLHLVDGHASGAISDHELSRRLHSLDGKGGFYSGKGVRVHVLGFRV